ncbi:hypothetical protein PFICI_07620 [Pestalotiopsis fici W106-1]|uniref:Uncharacterized protein n=1 Tax=Pestalotiopsis fici (strain W106-1 / CGMCC3.15140) TaxID=1229662 RepID=W3X4I6_PESFW|nr:uncharacterized protein PFICI_07620 [Pestalotiopsis fici W106-1]ETS80091.1 hypothetical protein PFICI_07620 [Pestalotiopsis fici W106-1]
MSSTDSLFSGQCPSKPAHAYSSMSSGSSSDLSSERVNSFYHSSATTGAIVSSGTSSTTSPQQAEQNMTAHLDGIMDRLFKK